jgi:hypothetical protein
MDSVPAEAMSLYRDLTKAKIAEKKKKKKDKLFLKIMKLA